MVISPQFSGDRTFPQPHRIRRGGSSVSRRDNWRAAPPSRAVHGLDSRSWNRPSPFSVLTDESDPFPLI
jgi:hypothetical protein